MPVVHLHKDLMVRLCGTHDFMPRMGLLLGVVRNHAKGKQLTIKSFEICYDREQYQKILMYYFGEKNDTNVLQVIGWFCVGHATVDDSSVKDMFQYFHYNILRVRTSTSTEENSEISMRDFFKDLVGLTILKGETKERSEQIQILKTTLRVHSIYITSNYLNALYEHVLMNYYENNENTYYFTPVASLIKHKERIIPNTNEIDQRVEDSRSVLYDVEEDPELLMLGVKAIKTVKPDRFSYIEFRRDVSLVIHSGQMSELYEKNLSWENDAQFCCDLDQQNLLIDENDIKQCMNQVFDDGRTVAKMEAIIEMQLQKHEALLNEYEHEYNINQALLEELQELEQMEQEHEIKTELASKQRTDEQRGITPAIATIKT